jgi:hypothetical protein
MLEIGWIFQLAESGQAVHLLAAGTAAKSCRGRVGAAARAAAPIRKERRWTGK